MTDDSQTTRAPALLDHPQRFGILPTWWFWNDRENWRLVRWPFALAVFVLVLAFAVFDFPLAVEFAVLMGGYVLALGSVEKYVRRQALKRRELAATPDPALVEERSDSD